MLNRAEPKRAVLSWRSRIAGALLAFGGSGCSFCFVTPPPVPAQQPVAHPKVECTTSNVAPVIDGIITGYEIVRTAYAATASNGDYANSPISRGADLVLGVVFTGVF